MELIEKFYTAFQNKDAVSMILCYHDQIEFQDPAFGKLKGVEAKAMWQMLCQNAKDLKIEFSNVSEDSVHWEAWYTFSKTGRSVHNIINAKFEFQDGKIIKHKDDFNLHQWASQALGWKGKLLGGTAFFKNKLQQQTNSILQKFLRSSAS